MTVIKVSFKENGYLGPAKRLFFLAQFLLPIRLPESWEAFNFRPAGLPPSTPTSFSPHRSGLLALKFTFTRARVKVEFIFSTLPKHVSCTETNMKIILLFLFPILVQGKDSFSEIRLQVAYGDQLALRVLVSEGPYRG